MAEQRKSIVILEDNDVRFELMSDALSLIDRELSVLRYDSIVSMTNAAKDWQTIARLISLDFDLSGSSTRNPGTGLDAVHFLTKHAPLCPIIVHTSLAEAGRLMTQTLQDRGWKARQVRLNKREAIRDWTEAVEAMTKPSGSASTVGPSGSMEKK